MSRLTGIFHPTNLSLQADTTNVAGYPAWTRPLEEQYLQMLLTNTFGGTFYAKKFDSIKEAFALHDTMIAKDPLFAAKAVVYARNEGYMRSNPIYGLAKLSAVDIKHGRHFEDIFDEVIRTPNDLSDFMTVITGLGRGQGGKRIKRAINNWLREKLSEYWVIKYGSDNKTGYSLKDIIRTTHPWFPMKLDPAYAKRAALCLYLLGKITFKEHETDELKINFTHMLPQIFAFEQLKKAETPEEKIAAITTGRLPHEVASTFAGKDASVWQSIGEQMPIFAMLKNLATFERHGIADALRPIIVAKLNDRDAIAKSKILPYRFYDAFLKVQTPWLKDVLRTGLELAFVNISDIPGKTTIFLDISGSMSGNNITTAAIFALALMKSAATRPLGAQRKEEAQLVLFDTEVQVFPFSAVDSILTQAEKIRGGGGTDTGECMHYLLAAHAYGRTPTDTIIVITDEQQNNGAPFMNLLAQYKQTVNKNVKTFIINVADERGSLLPMDENTYYVYGWSDKVLNFISMEVKGLGGMVAHVHSTQTRPARTIGETYQARQAAAIEGETAND